MSTKAEVIIQESQALLNDQSGFSYTSAKLIPLLNKAYRELQTKLQKAGQPIAKEVSSEILVPAGTKSMSAASLLPIDLLYPIRLYELINGQFFQMREQMWEPEFSPDQRLNYWNWREEDIKFLGSTHDVTIKIQYMKGLGAISTENSLIEVNNSTTYLAARTASIAAFVIGENPTRAIALGQDAEAAWDDLKTTQIKSRQSLPVRRRTNRYRR